MLANNISGGGAIAQNGTGTLTVSGTNTHTGGTLVNAGALVVGSAAALGATTGPLTVNAGTLDLNGNSPAVGTLSGTGGTITDNSAAPGTTTLTVGGAISTTFAGTIADGPNRTLALVRNGAVNATLTLASANAYSGGTTISGGAINASNDAALGTGPVVLAPGSQRLIVNDGITIANPITIDGGTPGVGRGLIEGSGTGISTVNSPITINAVTTNGGHFAGGGGTLFLNGPITSSAQVLVRAGNVVFSGGGSYTSIALTDAPRIGADDGLSTSAVADIGTSGAATFDLNGFDQTLAGLTRITGNAATVTNLGADISTLTLTPAAAYTYSGSITGNLTVVIDGPGSQTFSGPLSFPRLVTEAGTTNLGSSLAFADIDNNGGTLNINADAFGSTVEVNATTNFGVSQTLSALQYRPGRRRDSCA